MMYEAGAGPRGARLSDSVRLCDYIILPSVPLMREEDGRKQEHGFWREGLRDLSQTGKKTRVYRWTQDPGAEPGF